MVEYVFVLKETETGGVNKGVSLRSIKRRLLV